MVRSKFFCFILGISVRTMESTNVDCVSGCPNKVEKSDHILTVFENGTQTNYSLCESCAKIKLKDKNSPPLQVWHC